MQYEFPHARLIIFTKAPVAGQCKSRLAAGIGDEAAAKVQDMLIHRCLDAVNTSPLCPTELWCASDSTHPFFQSIATNYPLSLYNQQGHDLGQRMFHAMSNKPAQATIIIGTDCPGISRHYIKSALQVLHDGKDVVIGPAEDGGYVLLGLKQIEPRLFTNIEWGTAQVYAQTVQACQQQGLQWQPLQMLWDIDHESDLQRFNSLKSTVYE